MSPERRRLLPIPHDASVARPAAWAFLVAALLGLLAWLWLSPRATERQALLRLQPTERAALYGQTFAAFESMCTSPARELQPRCRAQAAWLREFPECGGECRAATERWTPAPTR